MQTKTGIIFLQKTKFQLYSPYIANILEFNFVPELVRDFDLVNKELFSNLLKAFLTNNKVPAGNFLIIIDDNASFIKDFTNSQPSQPASPSGNAGSPSAPTLGDLQAEANEFIEHVPFEIVASKTYPLPTGIRAYATNQEMYDVIKETLEKQGFLINIIIPAFAFGSEVGILNGLNINVIDTIFQKLNLVKEYNLLANPKSIVEDFMVTASEDKDDSAGVEIDIQDKSKANKPIVLIGIISVIVLVVLGTVGVLFWQFANPPYKPAANNGVINISTVTPTPVPSLATTDVQNLTVQIINISASPAASTTIVTTLTSVGFTNISTITQADLQTTSPLIIFSPNVAGEVKNSLVTEVRKILPAVISQDKQDATSDIVIITGR